ncbi:testis-specific Y-encoded-like protein 2 [Peromyscus maniculatus bairdii]|uniref:testis-specific Y-encoded-like protein 2 n=1 Tax=Peromyscus maniculatus bairdii TaxID=230844 RepID=UPI00042AF431|nr:testis-specific Y-encoded-like protein 2 [Peromyscus maniculatus bairdii]
MDRPDEGPPAKTPRLSSSEPRPRDLPPPPPPPLLRLPLPPPQQRPRPQEETEAAQVLADMRGVGPTLPPPLPYVILEEGGIRAYFTLGTECPGWDPAVESGFGDPPPTGIMDTFPSSETSGGSLEIDFQVAEPSSLAGQKALETCSLGGWGPQMLVGPKRKEEAIIIVEDDDEDEKESVRRRQRRRRRRRRRLRKVKESRERSAQRMESIMQALESIQMDLEAVNIKAGKAFLRLKRKFIQMRRPFLERRDLIIQHIPGFWVKAFLNHPKISILINQRDEDIFRYLTNLQVQDLRHISMGYKMKLYFQTNPYFTNMVIVKEFQRNRSGRLVSHSTPIRWHRGQEPQAYHRRNYDTRESFFNWFSNHSLPEADRIAEIIKNDLWVNPVRYYMRGSGYRTNRRKQERKESKAKKEYEMVIMEDAHDHYAIEDILSEISEIDEITDNETFHDIKISDFMETTDYFETTDNEVTDINEPLCDSEAPDHTEGPSNKVESNAVSTDDSSENPDEKNSSDSEDSTNENADGDSDNLEGDHQQGTNIQESSDSDNGDEGSDDEDNDGNEGDSEGSDDDGNEGDNEGSDDDDRDIKYYKNGIEVFDKALDNSTNQEVYEEEVEIISDDSTEEEEEEEEEEASEEDTELTEDSYIEEQIYEEGSDVNSDDSDVQEVLPVPNTWARLGKKGNIG